MPEESPATLGKGVQPWECAILPDGRVLPDTPWWFGNNLHRSNPPTGAWLAKRLDRELVTASPLHEAWLFLSENTGTKPAQDALVRRACTGAGLRFTHERYDGPSRYDTTRAWTWNFDKPLSVIFELVSWDSPPVVVVKNSDPMQDELFGILKGLILVSLLPASFSNAQMPPPELRGTPPEVAAQVVEPPLTLRRGPITEPVEPALPWAHTTASATRAAAPDSRLHPGKPEDLPFGQWGSAVYPFDLFESYRWKTFKSAALVGLLIMFFAFLAFAVAAGGASKQPTSPFYGWLVLILFLVWVASWPTTTAVAYRSFARSAANKAVCYMRIDPGANTATQVADAIASAILGIVQPAAETPPPGGAQARWSDIRGSFSATLWNEKGAGRGLSPVPLLELRSELPPDVVVQVKDAIAAALFARS